MLLEGGKVVALKGKDAESATAMAYYRMAKITGEAKYTKAALHAALSSIGDLELGRCRVVKQDKSRQLHNRRDQIRWLNPDPSTPQIENFLLCCCER